ncbi:MAG TPA: hypothetical protein QF469_06195 [Sphingomonas sanguinis]|uniref:hypothetical protein n=1 Tax=Sphingomonas sanguinis TaxID=33051 RepID=UPI002AC1F31E|nr:hypothetical protein [Sphingomonas sanguinis]
MHKLACVATATAGGITDGDRGHVIALADAESTSHGEFLFGGNRQDALASRRMSQRALSGFVIAIEVIIGVA